MLIPFGLRAGIRHVRRTFAGPGTLESTAARREVICPEEKAELSPAIVLPGQLERVIGAPAESSVAAEIEAMTTRQVSHAPTIAYHIRGAALLDGSVYAGRMRHFLFGDLRSAEKSPVRIEKAALASTFIGIKYFGHWLKDDCTLRLLCEDLGNPLCVRVPSHPDIASYSAYFQQDWSTSTDKAWIDHLLIMQDFGQNSFKKNRYEILRSRLRAKLGNQQVNSLIYLKRGSTGVSRLVHNEREIIDALAKRGATVLDVGSDRLERILTGLSQARLVISMEGSHCAHCVAALPSGSGLMLLQPPNRFCANQRGWADCLSIRSGFVVGEMVGPSSYSFSISEILETADLMLKHV
jgi:Glycosyltransferase 61